MSLLLELNNKSKRSIEQSTGILFNEIEKLDALTIDAKIEETKGIKLDYPVKVDMRAQGRGSIYIAFSRFHRYTQESLNKALDCIN